jgi:nitroreductase
MSSVKVPAGPQFGDPLPIDPPREDVLAFLARRRSASAVTLQAPGPSAEELKTLIRLATRVPDHGKLFPWRFIVIEGAAKARLVDDLTRLAETMADNPKAVPALAKLKTPPVTVAVVSRVTPGHAIPEWEQQLSSGAVNMTFLLAAQAMGYGANWITDWYSYDPKATALLGLQPGERIAGFIHLGTPSEPPLERVRPDVDDLITRL